MKQKYSFLHLGRLSVERRGIALVSVLTVLSLVSVFGLYFFTAVRMMSTQNALFGHSYRATLLARSGLDLVIAQLRYGPDSIRMNYCDTQEEAWYCAASSDVPLERVPDSQTSFASLTELRKDIKVGGNLSGSISLRIIDSARLINLNDRSGQAEQVLRNLCSILGLDTAIATALFSYRDTTLGGAFTAKAQMRAVSGVTDDIYAQLSSYVTLASWRDAKATTSYDADTYTTTISSGDDARSPINVNTASRQVLHAVLLTVIPSHAGYLASVLETHVKTDPFYTWEEFDAFIDADPALDPDEKDAVKQNANPNRIKPSPYTVEFCFHSGGNYEIESLGRVFYPNGSVAARRTITTFVNVYDILHHTLKEDFRDEDTNDDGDNEDTEYGEGNFNMDQEDETGERVDNTNYCKVTWLDSCPIDEGEDHGLEGYYGDVIPGTPIFGERGGYKVIPNAVKLGFWDNFDEDSDTNQSRAWWGDQFGDAIDPDKSFNVSDCAGYNYTYVGTDFCDIQNEGIFDPPNNKPPIEKLHRYDDYANGTNAFHLDDMDNEMWRPKTAGALEIITTSDFSNYYLGARGSWLGKHPNEYVADSRHISRPFQLWDASDGFYMRIFNYDGPRSSIGTEGNFPGFLAKNNNPPPEVDPPGRDYRDVGRVQFFYNTFYSTVDADGNVFPPTFSQLEFYLTCFGNHYEGIPTTPILWGDYFATMGPSFYASCDGMSLTNDLRYQRNKVYKLVCIADVPRFMVYTNAGLYQHSASYAVNENFKGYINLYSNANQAAWDDVRVIDDTGRFAKHFILPERALEVGSFHCEVTHPEAGGSEIFVVGTQNGSVRVGSETIDMSWSDNEPEFLSTDDAYYPAVNVDDMREGASVIEGDEESGLRRVSYSFRMTTTIDSTTPQVPAVEEVSMTYLVPTEQVDYVEQ